MKKKTTNFLLIGLVLLGVLSGCVPATPLTSAQTEKPVDNPTSQSIHLKVGVFNYISFAPLFIARDEGYFAEQGLDVELIDFGSASNEIIPLLVSGGLDVAGHTLNTSVFNAILQGNNLKFVADRGFINPDSCATDAWVASKTAIDSGVLTDPSKIKGKNVVFVPGGTIEFTLDVLLAQNGLTQNDIITQNISDSSARVEGLNNGSVDVSILSEPWITRAKTTGAGEIWIPFSDIVPNLSLGTIIFGPSLLEDNPEVGIRFMTAYLKAIEQFNRGKTDRNIEIIVNYTKLSPEDIRAACWTSFKDNGTIDTETMLAFQKWSLEKGYVDGSLKLDQFWTSQFVDEAEKRLASGK